MKSIYIHSIDWSEKSCILTTQDGKPVKRGQRMKDFRGDYAKISGGSAPHTSGSTGRVTTDSGDYYPSVFNLKWTPHDQVTA
jgi:hypothetical protein